MFGKKSVEKEALEMLMTVLKDRIASNQEALKELRPDLTPPLRPGAGCTRLK